MQLSQLVHYRNLLKERILENVDTIVKDQIGDTVNMINSHGIQFPELTQTTNEQYNNVLQSFYNFSTAIQDLYNKVQQLVTEIESSYYKESYRLYSEDFTCGTVEYILNRKINLMPDTVEYLQGRILSYSNWQNAGMIVRPGKESWINHLVACDPLYLVDTSEEMLAPVLQEFNQVYQNRLRSCYIKESTVDPILSQIPDDQIGFCLIYNFFNYKPIEIVSAFLTEIYHKLKPGGVVAFTFNDCDRRGAVELMENKFMCYTPQTKILSISTNLGYQIHHTYCVDAACSWMELKKPGHMTSLRGGQSLARIVAKSK